MGRIRTIKPEFFRHEDLYELEKATKLPIRLAYAGLWTCCDREGRFKWRPRSLKVEVLPYDECDFSRVLDALATRGFIVKYRVAEEDFGYVPSFQAHQCINNREASSTIPDPSLNEQVDASVTREARVDHATGTRVQGKGKEGKGKEGGGRVPDASPEFDSYLASWNEHCGSLSKIDSLCDKRRAKLRTRIAEGLTPEKFLSLVETCAKTPFLRGENDRNWRADFDWLVKNDHNGLKVREGKYGKAELDSKPKYRDSATIYNDPEYQPDYQLQRPS
jgi:hypothetical protein